MIRPIGVRIAEGDLGLLEVAALYSILRKSGCKEICLLNKGELSSLYGTREGGVVDEIKIWFYPNIPNVKHLKCKDYLGGRSVLSIFLPSQNL